MDRDPPPLDPIAGSADEDAARIAAILADTFDAENHESLDDAITRLMLELSADGAGQDTAIAVEPGRLRRMATAMLLVWRRERTGR